MLSFVQRFRDIPMMCHNSYVCFQLKMSKLYIKFWFIESTSFIWQTTVTENRTGGCRDHEGLTHSADGWFPYVSTFIVELEITWFSQHLWGWVFQYFICNNVWSQAAAESQPLLLQHLLPSLHPLFCQVRVRWASPEWTRTACMGKGHRWKARSVFVQRWYDIDFYTEERVCWTHWAILVVMNQISAHTQIDF